MQSISHQKQFLTDLATPNAKHFYAKRIPSKLFLSAFFGHEVGAAEGSQQGDAGTEGSVLVAIKIVARQFGCEKTFFAVTTCTVELLVSDATFEQAAAIFRK